MNYYSLKYLQNSIKYNSTILGGELETCGMETGGNMKNEFCEGKSSPLLVSWQLADSAFPAGGLNHS
jgi:hypothetical protein